MSNFRAIDRKTGYLLPPSVDEWLPEKHLARFIVDVIDGLDLGRMSRAYRGTGSASYHPRTVLSILVYGYATGVFSSRKLERATWDSVAFRYIAGGEHPDHDTIATFRRRFLKDIEKLFVDVLRLAREMGVLGGNPMWESLRAVREGRVYLADGNAFFNRPGPRLVESAEIIAEILHPDVCNFGRRGCEFITHEGAATPEWQKASRG